jgi:hypothetical protein
VGDNYPAYKYTERVISAQGPVKGRIARDQRTTGPSPVVRECQ